MIEIDEKAIRNLLDSSYLLLEKIQEAQHVIETMCSILKTEFEKNEKL